MKFDESLIRRHKKIFYLGSAIGVLAGIIGFVGGVIEHDWALILYFPLFIIIVIGFAFFIKRF